MTERDVFIAALQMEGPAQRQAYLDDACALQPGLRQQVENLLRLYEGAGSFLERPAAEPAATGAFQAVTEQGPSSEAPGTMVGPYKLIELLGEGGMGTVWMAQQQAPVKRLVALKLIKAGMDSRQVIARFEAERQALALMDHPNIARVLDGGTTEGGRPYLAMDLVKGVPITRYCDEQRLTPRQRLELFVPVCQAVQHAHQKGVIHRDIKPSNVLVALYDGKPVPKVIDFGVAKAAGQALTEKTLVTGFGAIVGTLEYMSPEQAELNNLDIDTRSDVYSLGVLLYELLTGTTPLDRKRLRDTPVLELLRIVREQDAPTLCDRLSTTEGLPAIAANRGLEPGTLAGQLRGELDWIVMKALEKDRSRRYETANGFAMDVQRYLNDEPVLACPPSAWYRFGKFVRRNRSRLALAAAMALLVLGAGAFAWYTDRQATQQRAEAKARLGQDEEAVTALLDQCEANLRADQPDADRAALAYEAAERRAADGGAERLAGRLEQCRDGLALLRELNAIDNRRWFSSSEGLGARADDPRVIKAAWRAALARYGVVAGETPATQAARWVNGSLVRERILASLELWLAYSRSFGERADEKFWVRAVLRAADPDQFRDDVRHALLRDNSREAKALGGRPEALAQPARFAAILGLLEAIPAERRRAILRSALRTQPGDLALLMAMGKSYPRNQYDRERAHERVRWFQAAVAAHPGSTAAHNNLAAALLASGDTEGAIGELWASVRADPKDPFSRCYLGGFLLNQERSRENKAGVAEALAHLQAAADLGPKEPHTRASLGLALALTGEWDRGIAILREAVRLDPKNAHARHGLGMVLSKSGARSGNEAKLDEALVHLQEAADIEPNARYFASLGLGWQRKPNVDRAITAYREAIQIDPMNAPAHSGLAWVLAAGPDRVRDGKQALVHATRACELNQWKEPESLRALAAACAEIGDFGRAVELQEKALSFPNYEKEAGEGGWDLLTAYARKKRISDAKLDPPRKALPMPREYFRPDPTGVFARIDQGNALWKQKKRDGAIAEFRKAVDLDPQYIGARTILARALKDNGKPDEAIDELRKAVRIAPENAALRGRLASALEAGGKLVEAIAELRKAVDLEPKVIRWRNNLANALEEKGDLDGAIRELQQAAKINPKSTMTRFNLASALKTKGRPDEALAQLREVIKINGGDAATHFTVGDLLKAKGDLDGAIVAFRTATRINRKFFPAHFYLGNALQAMRDLPGAIASYRKAVQCQEDFHLAHNSLGWLLAAGPDGVRDGKQALVHATRACELTGWKDPGNIDTLAAAYAEAGDFQKAAESQTKALSFPGFEKAHGKEVRERLHLYEWKKPYRDPSLAIDIDTKVAAEHHDLGIDLRRQRKFDESAAAFRKAIKINPNHAPTHCELGITLGSLGKLPEAIAAYRRAIALNPNYAIAYNNLGDALRGQGELDEAVAAFNKAIDSNPNYTEAYCNLGLTLREQKKLNDAVAAYRKAIDIEPKFALAHHGLGVALYAQKKLPQAEVALLTAIKLNSTDASAYNLLGNVLVEMGELNKAAVVYHNLGIVLRKQRKLGESVEAFRKAIEFDRTNAKPHIELGNALVDLGKPGEAVTALRRATELAPNDALGHYNLGIAYAKQGKPDEAIAAYKKAIDLKPDYAEAHCNLGSVYLGLGQFATALEAYRKGHDLGRKKLGWRYPSLSWVKNCERLLAQEKRLPDVLAGGAAGAAELISLAGMCLQYKARYADAALLYEKAFAARPALAEGPDQSHLFHAARAAALAGCGKGAEALGAVARARLRGQARSWLEASLEVIGEFLDDDPETTGDIAKALGHWLDSPDLSGVRDDKALAELPEEERQRWTKLWDGVRELVRRAGKK